MSWCWINLGSADRADATASAAMFDEHGAPAGWLMAWRRRARPARDALRADDRIVDSDGAEAWISLVRAPDGLRLPFDDLAVQQARRDVLAREPMDAVTTLLRDDRHFEGALTVARGEQVRRFADDPFARIFPQRILRVDAGILGTMPAPCGPTIERYGSAQPWPWDRFIAP